MTKKVKITVEDQIELEKFKKYIARREKNPDEALITSYSAIYGEVIYDYNTPLGLKKLSEE